jgi:hypothetical protein
MICHTVDAGCLLGVNRGDSNKNSGDKQIVKGILCTSLWFVKIMSISAVTFK